MKKTAKMVGLKVKTPLWWNKQVTDLVKLLDERSKDSMFEQGKSVAKKEKIYCLFSDEKEAFKESENTYNRTEDRE